jgi:hypothetical protein
VITPEEAVDAARRALPGLAEVPEDGPIETVRRRGRYVVTFVRVNPPGVRGPDYDARVTIDARTGGVLEVLGAS